MEFLVIYCNIMALSANEEPFAPAVDWIRIRSVEASLVYLYAVRPPIWIEQVAEGVVLRFELRVHR